MKLGLIINCVGYDKNRKKLSFDLANKVLPILDDLGIEWFTIMPDRDWLNAQIEEHKDGLSSQDIKEINRIIKSKNNKGFVVGNCIEEFKQDNMDCVLHIDGSEKFHIEDINKVVQIILEPSIDAVLTKRANRSGMDKFRDCIEEFEREIVIERFPNAKIEDGQSGCWGIKLHEKLNLTAKGYEIELNILINLLKHKKNIYWLPINLKDVTVSQFKFPDNIEKMGWLSKELSMPKLNILKLSDSFKTKNKKKIKEAEEHSIELKKPENTFDNYISEIKKSDKFLN